MLVFRKVVRECFLGFRLAQAPRGRSSVSMVLVFSFRSGVLFNTALFRQQTRRHHLNLMLPTSFLTSFGVKLFKSPLLATAIVDWYQFLCYHLTGFSKDFSMAGVMRETNQEIFWTPMVNAWKTLWREATCGARFSIVSVYLASFVVEKISGESVDSTMDPGTLFFTFLKIYFSEQVSRVSCATISFIRWNLLILYPNVRPWSCNFWCKLRRALRIPIPFASSETSSGSHRFFLSNPWGAQESNGTRTTLGEISKLIPSGSSVLYLLHVCSSVFSMSFTRLWLSPDRCFRWLA